mgnify:FL=1|jgi:uncharacterized Zn-finger protein
MKYFNSLLICISILLLTSCGKESSQWNYDYYCNFSLDLQYHPTSKLATIRENANRFVIVRDTTISKIRTLVCTANDGTKDKIQLTTDAELYRLKGMGASRGIIIGCLFGADATSDAAYSYIAYDDQCPVCVKTDNTWHAHLQFGTTYNTVVCPHCGRTYSLTTASSTDGNRLITYGAGIEYSGSQIMLYAHNGGS